MSDTPAYQVLARKYRPQTFADLIGQEAMVRTLRNAFEANRIAHAFVMTGVRGVGKTTTARIIAKGLNCIGPAGAAGADLRTGVTGFLRSALGLVGRAARTCSPYLVFRSLVI